MLDFRKNSSQRNEQARHERRRLMGLVLMLGIVLLLTQRATNPTLWRGFDRLFSPPRQDQPVKSIALGQYFPGVEPEELEAIRDDSPSLRGEQACSLRLLDILRQTDSETLREASLGPVTYAQVFRQPDQYRGQLVTVSGVVGRATRVEVPPNDYGIKDYYQIWLRPSDNPSALIVVYCLRLPKGFPTGMDLAEPVELTGFFFKRLAYQARDAIRTAPELLAGTLQWQQQPDITPEGLVETRTILSAIGAAGLLALVAAWYVYLRTRSPQPALPERLPNVEVLAGLDKKKE